MTIACRWYHALAPLLLLPGAVCAQDITLRSETFTWRLAPDGRTVSLVHTETGQELCASPSWTFRLTTARGVDYSEQVTLDGDRLEVRFTDDAGRAVFRVSSGRSHVLLRLESLDTADEFESIVLGRVMLPRDGIFAGLLNAWRGEEYEVALMGISPAVRPAGAGPSVGGGSASPGATARALHTEEARAGGGAAHLIGLNPTDQHAWTVWYNAYPRPLDLTDHAGIGLWVNGDGNGQSLKVQLHDGKSEPGHWRDYYIPITFEGWRWVELPRPEGEPIDYTNIIRCNLYFNGIPPGRNVEVIVDDIRALAELGGPEGGGPDDIVLADFEDPAAPYFEQPATTLSADCIAEYGTEDAGVGLIVARAGGLLEAIEEFEPAAGLPSPRFNGEWNKTSPDVKRSYLFITSFSAEDTDLVIDYARQGGFSTILIGCSSWTTSFGKFPLNTRNFPGGLEQLADTVRRMEEAGFRVGLHWLAAAVSSNSEYLTPVPDDRLVMDLFLDLAADVDETVTFIPTTAPPTDWPPEEGGYMGDSAIMRIGDELISYGSLSLEEPFGFRDCRRGLYGTQASAHEAGASIAHMMRGYSFFLHDPDKSLTQEVAENLAAVANAVGANMVYYDGSERLKGPHWRYNALLQKAYWDALGRDDILMQGSSVSHWSWHMLARYASADGHDDLKGYLDERLPRLQWYFNNLMPLDLGWYYIYGMRATPDQIEYICQKALGLDCSFSIQTNPQNIREHPRMDEFIRIIRDYEDLRLSGRVPEETLEALRTPGEEYMLSMEDGEPRFRRVKYFPAVALLPDGEPPVIPVTVDADLGTPRVGIEVRAASQVAPGPEYDDPDNWLLEDFSDVSPYLRQQGGDLAQHFEGTNLAGSTSPGVTQALEVVTEDARFGDQCVRYSATSTRTDNGGWSAFGRRLAEPLDLREHVAIGMWVHGDASGVLLKVQPRDARSHAQDHYIRIDFSGWRYVVFERPETPSPEPIEYHDVSSLTFYFNAIPARTTCTVMIDGIKALRSISEVSTPAPVLAVGDRALTFDAALPADAHLIYRGGETAVVKAPGAEPVTVAARGDLGVLPPGESEIAVRPPADAPQMRELFVRALVVYD